MLLLAIDVGNTNTVFAVYSEDKFLIEWRCATQVSRTADEYYVWLSSLIEFQSQKIFSNPGTNSNMFNIFKRFI